ncbi:MAG: hypothetical protein QXL96_10420 [Ignisphaera sp.]
MDRLIATLYRFYNRDVNKVIKHIDRISKQCNYVDLCIKILTNERNKIEHAIARRILRGRKALTTRFTKNTMKCRDLVQKYFPELLNPYVFMYRSLDELANFMKRLFDDRVAEAYVRFAEINNPIIVTREGVILITKNSNNLQDFSIYVDDCIDTKNYAVFKVVGAYKLMEYIYRIKWVGVLGLDKFSNQVFLHYVPPTLVLHKVERCRLWLLNIVDDYGRPYEHNYILVEV